MFGVRNIFCWPKTFKMFQKSLISIKWCSFDICIYQIVLKNVSLFKQHNHF